MPIERTSGQQDEGIEQGAAALAHGRTDVVARGGGGSSSRAPPSPGSRARAAQPDSASYSCMALAARQTPAPGRLFLITRHIPSPKAIANHTRTPLLPCMRFFSSSCKARSNRGRAAAPRDTGKARNACAVVFLTFLHLDCVRHANDQ